MEFSKVITRDKWKKIQNTSEELWCQTPIMDELYYLIFAVCSQNPKIIIDEFHRYGSQGIHVSCGNPTFPEVVSDCFQIATNMAYPQNMKVMCAIIEGMYQFLLVDREYQNDINCCYLLFGQSWSQASNLYRRYFQSVGVKEFENVEDWVEHSDGSELNEYYEIFDELSFYPFTIWYMLRFHLRHRPLTADDEVLLYALEHFHDRKLPKFAETIKRPTRDPHCENMPDWVKQQIKIAIATFA